MPIIYSYRINTITEILSFIIMKEGIFMFFIDYWYLVLVVPTLILGMIAQSMVSSSFKKYSRVYSRTGYTASEVARQILSRNGLSHIQVVPIRGELTDNYNPQTQTVSLSESVYNSNSVASIGVAAHEVGHAIQHAKGYTPIKIRSAILPITNFGSSISPILILLGLVLGMNSLAIFGVILFSTVALFQLVTLPVEFNASKRALQTLKQDGILVGDELSGARKVLSAAAMTYVAALITSLANLLRLVLIVGRNRDD